MTRLLIVGPPGAGKGTQAARLSAAFGIPTISTGDIFRYNIANETAIGKQVKAIVDAGDYVPDELTNAMVTDRLNEADAAGGFLLDGYPRTPDQVRVPRRSARSRTGTRSTPSSGWWPTGGDHPPAPPSRRASRAAPTTARRSIRHRQEVYQRETAPLLSMFADRGLLVEVDGLGPVDEVHERVTQALADRGLIVSPTA